MKLSEVDITKRYLSKVIWFGTKTGEKFGFIEFDKNDGIFFHKNNILSNNLHKLKNFVEGAFVTFKVRQSKKEQNKLEAYDVSLLETESSFDYLLNSFLRIEKIFFIEKRFSIEANKKLLKILSNRESILVDDYSEYIDKKLDFITEQEEYSLLDIKILAKLSGLKNKSIFERIFDIYLTIELVDKNTSSITLLVKDFADYFDNPNEATNLAINYLKIKNNQNAIHYLMWSEELEVELPLEYILSNVFYLNNKYDYGFLNHIPESQYSIVLTELLEKFKVNYLDFKNYQEAKTFYQILSKLDLQEFISMFLSFTQSWIKIELFINEIINHFEFENYIKHIRFLDNAKQQLFIKKIFHLIHIGKNSLELCQINKLEPSDYSSKVVIQLLNKISNTEKITKYSLKGDVLSLVSESVNDFSDVLSLNGYFDLCSGRTAERKKTNINHETGEEIVEYIYETESKSPKEPEICEGRLSKSKSGEINLSQGARQFWWCKNLPCFDVCRKLKEPSDWKDYSILDFLNILQIAHNPNDIELLYATINKVNSYLQHLNCRDCKRILKPIQDSRYAFDRVNTFSCDNQDCQNEDKIYITHCSNGKCESIIDSRDMARCPNNWHICKNCFACCATKVMYDRNHNLRINRQKLNKVHDPHRGCEIFCPNCGDSLNYKDPAQQAQEYKVVLEDFERLARIFVPTNEQRLVGNHGVNKFGNKWFVVYQSHLAREQFLNHLYYWQSLGFHILDFPTDLNKKNYLVAEPIKKLEAIANFKCQNCNNRYDLNSDPSRLRAIEYWHFNKANQDNW
ncbi:cold shock domain-containing protein [Psychrobacter ciconiae]|uniref:cold shock domain-containing protein n=1 Tax=Psychrobacter ciconiae TaxID=1553449 RepID=UPI00191A4454|nr:cold shock domain-containing protein [Psychrobacter ciconiae]